MDIIRKKIIEALGGVTKQDYHATMKDYHRTFMQGEMFAMHRLQEFMRDIHGMDAEMWADSVWKYVCKYISERKEYEI